MIDTDINKQPLNRVTAIFADSSLSFVLPQGATLENIADCLDDFGVRRTLLSSNSLPQRCKSRARNWLPFRTGLLAELPGLERLPDPWLGTPTVQTISSKKRSPKPGHHQSKFKDATNAESLALHNTAQHLLHPIFAGSGLGPMICAFGAHRH